MSFTFTPAQREGSFARVALAGPSGSGKTWTSLTLARELSNKVAVIDTERGSAKKYAGEDGFAFDVLEMTNFDPRELVKALAAAGAAGYGCIIVDSLSHFWMGTGGMLEQVDNATRRANSSNSFSSGWKEARPMERAMIEALLSYPGHVIVTMRTKSEWVVEEDNRGKKVPRKIGTKPEQREGIEYEFDLVADMDLEHNLIVSKSRIAPLADLVLKRPDGMLGQQILAWIGDAPPPSALEFRDRALEKTATVESLRELYTEAVHKRLDGAAVIDDTGETVTLGDLIKGRAEELKRVSA